MQYYYYIIKNLQNDKKYVGITTNPTERKQDIEEFLLYKPLIIKPVSTRAEA